MMVGHESEQLHFTSAGREVPTKEEEGRVSIDFMYNLTKFSSNNMKLQTDVLRGVLPKDMVQVIYPHS